MQLHRGDTLHPALFLLLTHPGYEKVAFGACETLVGSLWQDFGVRVDPLFNCSSLVPGVPTAHNLIATYKKLARVSANVRTPSQDTEWDSSLSRWDIEFASTEVVACLWIWTHSEGKSRIKPVDYSDAFVECEDCGARFQSQSALKNHVAECHTVLCPLCKTVLKSIEALERHQRAAHVQCPDCGVWVSQT